MLGRLAALVLGGDAVPARAQVNLFHSGLGLEAERVCSFGHGSDTVADMVIQRHAQLFGALEDARAWGAPAVPAIARSQSRGGGRCFPTAPHPGRPCARTSAWRTRPRARACAGSRSGYTP